MLTNGRKKKNTFTPMPVWYDKSGKRIKRWVAEIHTMKKGVRTRKKIGRYATDTEARIALDMATGKRQMKLF